MPRASLSLKDSNQEDVQLDISYSIITGHTNCGMHMMANISMGAKKRVKIGFGFDALSHTATTEIVRNNLEAVLRSMWASAGNKGLWLVTGSMVNIPANSYYLRTEQFCAILEARPDLVFSSRSHVVTNPNYSYTSKGGLFSFTFVPLFEMNSGVGVMAMPYCNQESVPEGYATGRKGLREYVRRLLNGKWRSLGGLKCVRPKRKAAAPKQ